jgi:hypothetical protein
VDQYIFAVPPTFNHTRFSEDNGLSPLIGTTDVPQPFSDAGLPGILNKKWTYVADTFTYLTGASTSPSFAAGGFQFNIPSGGAVTQKDPNSSATIPENQRVSPISVFRIDIEDGVKFFDTAINPSASLSLPPVLLPFS